MVEVLMFCSPTCSPCKVATVRLRSLIAEGKVRKLCITENQDLVEKYNVRSVPTFVFLDEGEVVDNFVGLDDVAHESILEFVNLV